MNDSLTLQGVWSFKQANKTRFKGSSVAVSLDDLKKDAAAAALEHVESGMRLGLGTGSTAKHFVDQLGVKVANGFDCICVPTSEVTRKQAQSLNIPLSDLDTLTQLDLTIDGADEISPDFGLIKGGGGALLREKIVAHASKQMFVIADETKLVEKLGAFSLPIEVNTFGLGATQQAVEICLQKFTENGGSKKLDIRRRGQGDNFITDGGHLILDASFGLISDAVGLSNALLMVPGVVQHGLFLNMCDRVFIAAADGVVVKDRLNNTFSDAK